jgi:hypothetical protein
MRGLRRHLATVRLGLRLIRTRRGSLVPAGATLLSAAVSVLVLLGVVAAANVARGQIARVAGRIPAVAGPGQMAKDAPLVAYSTEPYGNQVIERFSVAVRGRDGPVPPGIERLPRPGEMFASAALAARVRTDSVLRTMFPHRLAGLVAPEGLRGPRELVAWAGFRPEQLLDSDEAAEWMSLDSFGDASVRPELLQPGYFIYYGAALAILLLVPLGLVAGGAARLSSRLRERRLAALRTLGLSPRRTVGVAVVEAAVVSGIGAVLALLATPGLRRLVGSGPLFGVDFFPSDVRVGLAATVVAAAGVLAFVVLVAGMAASRVMRKPTSTRPTIEPAPLRRSATALLVAGGSGLALVAWPLGQVLPPLPALALFYVATFAFAAGLGIGLPALVQRLAARAANRSRGTATLLAWRRLAADPGPPTRLLAPVCALLFAATAFLPFMGDLAGDADWIARTQAQQIRGGRQLLRVQGVPPAVDLTALVSQPGARAVIPVAAGHDVATGQPAGVDVLIATCEQIRAFALRPIDCPDGVWRILTAGEGDTVEGIGSTELAMRARVSGRLVSLPPPIASLDLGLGPLDNLTTALVVSPGTIVDPGDVEITDYLGVVAPNPEAVAAFHAGVASLAPAAGFLESYQAGVEGARRLLPLLRYLLALLTVGVALTICAVLVAGLHVGVERARDLAPLCVLGAPTRLLRASQAIVMAAPGLIGVAVASTVGLLAAQGFVAIQRSGLHNLPTVVGLALVGILISLAVSIATVVGIDRPMRNEITLRE